jgi:putative DNA primase/helicase
MSNIKDMVTRRVQAEKASLATDEAPEVSAREVEAALANGEVGDAGLLARVLKNRFAFDCNAGEWYAFSGAHWVRDGKHEIFQRVGEIQDLYARERARCEDEAARLRQAGDKDAAESWGKKAAAFATRVDKLNATGRRDRVLKAAATGEESLALDGSEWDSCPGFLPVENGLVNLETGGLLESRPEHYIRTVAPVAYDPAAECPTWQHFLGQVLDNAAVVAYVQRLLGYALLGRPLEHCFVVMHGAGRNGKGTLLETLKLVLGPLMGKLQSEMLLDQGRVRSSAGPSPDVMELLGRRLVWASETDAGVKFSPAKVKEFSGGDTLMGRRPHDKRSTEFAPSHVLVLMTNDLPQAPASDYGFWSRLHVVRFALRYVDQPKAPNERRKDKTLPVKLEAEAPGILAWMVRGCLAYQKEGLAPPPEVLHSVEEYRQDEDFLGPWLDENCIVDPRVYEGMPREEYAQLSEGVQAPSSELYSDFKTWATEKGGWKTPPSLKVFGAHLAKRFPRHKSGGIIYSGIRLK